MTNIRLGRFIRVLLLVTVSPKPPNPWITPAIQEAKRTRRYLERFWRKSRFPSDRSKYVKQAHLCNRMMERARREHIANYIHENENDAGKLWRAVNSVLHRVPNTSMPSTSDITTLCHSFSTFCKQDRKNKNDFLRS